MPLSCLGSCCREDGETHMQVEMCEVKYYFKTRSGGPKAVRTRIAFNAGERPV